MYYKTILTFLIFIVFQLVHVLKKAVEAKDLTGKRLGIKTYFSVDRCILIAIRVLVGDLFALLYIESPKIFELFGMTIPAIPMGYALAGLSGFFWDSVLHAIEKHITLIDGEIPEVE